MGRPLPKYSQSIYNRPLSNMKKENEKETHSRSNSRPMMRRLGSVYSKDDMTITTGDKATSTTTTLHPHHQAKGCMKIGVIARLKLEEFFEAYGQTVASSKRIQMFLLFVLILTFGGCGFGLRNATIETDVSKLWVESGGRLEIESKYISKWRGTGTLATTDTNTETTTCVSSSPAIATSTSPPTAERASPSSSSKTTDNTPTSPPPSATDTTPPEDGFSSQTSSGVGSTEIIIVTPVDSTMDVISTTILKEKYQLMIDITDMQICIDTETKKVIDCPTVPKSNLKTFSWIENLCSRITPPKELSSFASVIPCNHVTVLDCFNEGNFDWSQDLINILPAMLKEETLGSILKNDYGVVGFDDLPSITSSSEILHQAVTGGCFGFARKVPLMKWHESLIIGNPKVTTSNQGKKIITSAEALQSVFLLATTSDVAKNADVSNEIAALALKTWKKKLENITKDQTLNVNDVDRKYKTIKVSVLLSNALTEVLKETTGSNLYLSAVGVLIMTSFVILSLIETPCTSNETKCGWGASPLGIIGLVLVISATVAAFGFTSWIGLSFNATSMQVLPFLALGLGVDDFFIVISCWSGTDKSVKNNTPKIIGRVFSRAGPSISMTSLANFIAFMIGSIIPLPAVSNFCLQASAVIFFNYFFLLFGLALALTKWEEYITRPNKNDANINSHKTTNNHNDDVEAVIAYESDESNESDFKDDDGQQQPQQQPMDRCIHSFVDIVLHPIVKTICILLFTTFLIVSIFYIGKVKDGLDVSDIAPTGSSLSLFLKDKTTYFSSFDATIVTKNMTYQCQQKELLHFIDNLKSNEWVSYVADDWLTLYIKYLNSKNLTTLDGYVPTNTFYKGLNDWDNDLGSSLDVLSAGKSNFGANDQGGLMYTQISFTINGLNTTDAYSRMIKSVRKVCTDAAIDPSNVLVFPEGIPFSFWEQYITLRENFWNGLYIVFVALSIVIIPFVVNPMASLIIVLHIAMIVIEIFGLLGMFNIKFSAIPAVSLLMSVGISVEFVAHFVLAFLMEFEGTRNDRVRITYIRMLPPILQGGISTFVSIVLLGFSNFAFVRRYFFLPFVFVCVVGLLNGLILLPIVLSLIGPTAVECCPSAVCSKKKQPRGEQDDKEIEKKNNGTDTDGIEMIRSTRS